MKRLLPEGVDWAILATMAVLSAAIVALAPAADEALVVLLFPFVLVAMLMGARRCGRLAVRPQEVEAPQGRNRDA